MPDITMCADTACPQKDTCYRSPASGTQENGPWQSWFYASPRKPEGCAYYWPLNTTETELKRLMKPTSPTPCRVR